MNIPVFFARRYLFSQKSQHAINIISWISVLSIAIATFALVVVLSAFNGLQSLVESMYEQFEPDVKISPVSGKWLDISPEKLRLIKDIEGVSQVTPVLEDIALLKHGDRQSPCVLKGVEDEFIEMTNLQESVIDGKALLHQGDLPLAIIGYGMAGNLSVYLDDVTEPLKLYVPKFSTSPVMDLSQAFYTRPISPSGVFLINPDIDNKYLIVPISFARNLLQIENGYTDFEIKVDPDKEGSVKREIENILGSNYSVANRFELNKVIYQTNQSEKTATFLILVFILIVATFNVISTLTMIVLDKKSDIETMYYLGFEAKTIRRIFLSEGLLINAIGAISGMLAGILVCYIQAKFGLVRLEGGIVDFYPVKVMAGDLLVIISVVAIIGFIASYFPSKILINRGWKWSKGF